MARYPHFDRGYDAGWFLKERTRLIKLTFQVSTAAQERILKRIEEREKPFDNPPYREDGEPPYLEEWEDMHSGIHLLGLQAISMLSDSLKVYFRTQREDLHYRVGKQAGATFVELHKEPLGRVLGTDWSDCPADWAILEQVARARNVAQHTQQLHSFRDKHDHKTLERFADPFFIGDWQHYGDAERRFFKYPVLEVESHRLFAAIDEVNKLADWVSSRIQELQEGSIAATVRKGKRVRYAACDTEECGQGRSRGRPRRSFGSLAPIGTNRKRH
ncbi:MAG: hypothetical protein E5Y63_28875 [Mesorhizobium sp.]|uniref:hypothetical protein n=1 Tax=Mesorhizobium sp. TaxID=1871066 RepID=UPI00120F6C63|nr:hypothetical protein [Mesorhizobium sp.]TIM26513.1 MAG: hypothetical protein E5Y63_28875 [Mesorhizobium sp.]